ncbi:MAG: hypothetical protein U5L96_06205 [Owenweeksia sp.]|nr:hypothetical protein [Owenweeksia sp.]
MEVATVSTYNLPRGGSNVYVEVSYKSNIPFVVGLIANSQSGINQSPTVVVNPKDYWNKIYVNLVTDLTAYAGADNYKIFIGASHESSLDTGKVFLDNLKLVY